MEHVYIDNDECKTDVEIVPSYGLLYITRAYNQKEISFDEWLRLSREWAEKIIEQYKGSVA